MNEPQDTESVEQLLDMGPAHVSGLLDRVRAGQSSLPDDFNWLGLAEAAALLARSGGARPDVEWARAATAIYEWLGRAAGGEGFTYTLSSMNLRAYLISRLGAAAGHDLLDAGRVVEWFRGNLPTDSGKAEESLAVWKAVTSGQLTELTAAHLENIKGLRRVKNMLNVLSLLDEAGALPPDPDVRAWLSLKNNLP